LSPRPMAGHAQGEATMPSCLVTRPLLDSDHWRNMESVVLQLQRECLDSRVSILEILRKALVIARKLTLADAQTWIEKELNGYKNGDTPPLHRLLTGEIRVLNPYHGWQPVIFEDAEEAAYRRKCFVGQPIGELEDLIKRDDGVLQFSFDPATLNQLMKGMNLPLPPTRVLDRSSLRGILDAVRNMVLDWTLKLEKDGIMGEGLAFTAKEKEAASTGHYTINYNAPVGTSQVQQATEGSTQSMPVVQTDFKALGEFVADLKRQIPALQLEKADGAQLKADADALDSHLTSPRPNRMVIEQLMASITSILEGCTGSLLASGLLHRLTGFGG